MNLALTAALTAAGGFALGYAARCVRPLDRIDTWAWDQVHRRARDLRDGPAPKRPGWWAAQAVFAVELLAALVMRPRHTVNAWKHRNDPPPPRSPAPTFDPDWAAKRRAAAEEQP